ncbi:hypothetical protein FB451DRAFT_1184938 [Mycena latifolia]|nr:hypothetical protein FB451DRAFT_1184938 [Mycena latifolia]
MATHTHYRTTSITASSPSRSASNRLSLLSIASLESSDSNTSNGASSISTDTPIIITTTVTTTTRTFTAPALPPFAPSLGSDDPLPRPRRGAPPVAPALNLEERQRMQGLVRKLRRAVGLERRVLDPALCEGWD